MNHTIYFKDKHGDAAAITQIILQAGELARALGIGTSPADLLVAAVNGAVNIKPTTPLNPTDTPTLTLNQLLERSAALLNDVDPALAQELRKRRIVLMAVLS